GDAVHRRGQLDRVRLRVLGRDAAGGLHRLRGGEPDVAEPAVPGRGGRGGGHRLPGGLDQRRGRHDRRRGQCLEPAVPGRAGGRGGWGAVVLVPPGGDGPVALRDGGDPWRRGPGRAGRRTGRAWCRVRALLRAALAVLGGPVPPCRAAPRVNRIAATRHDAADGRIVAATSGASTHGFLFSDLHATRQ